MSFWNPRKSVETLTASLSKIVEDLHLHATVQSDHGEHKTAKADVLNEEADRHHAEAFKARAVANKINTLLS
jgi:Asp/Glu/hydantoin racemase